MTGQATGQGGLVVYVVCRHPADYPDKWTVRRHHFERGVQWVDFGVALYDSLEAVHGGMPPGLVRIGPKPGEDPVIAEVWI